nr:hypothetical transcript [Hymenolepis microstoma]
MEFEIGVTYLTELGQWAGQILQTPHTRPIMATLLCYPGLIYYCGQELQKMLQATWPHITLSSGGSHTSENHAFWEV